MSSTFDDLAVHDAGAPTTELATPGRRFAAVIVDGLVGSIALWVPVLVLGFLSGFVIPANPDGSVPAAGVGVLVLGFGLGLFAWLRLVLLPEGATGQSYGKHVLDIATVGKDSGAPVGSGRILGRIIVRVLGAYVLGLGLLWILFDKQRQGWHDKAVGTVVVLHRTERRSPLAFLKGA